MITQDGKYYLYRHIREDKNEPFYFGIGTKTEGDLKYDYYSRAKRKKRNCIWELITKKTNYEIDIILESDSMEFIKEKEREFISMYGRIDIGTGILSNFTDGGEGIQNKSRIAIENQLKTAKENGSYYKNIERLKQYGRVKGIPFPTDRKTFLYTINGDFAREFNTREACAEFILSQGNHITRMIRLKESHKGFIFFNEFKGLKCALDGFLIKKDKEKPVNKICPITLKVVYQYKSLTIAGEENNTDKHTIKRAIKSFKLYNNFYWKYL